MNMIVKHRLFEYSNDMGIMQHQSFYCWTGYSSEIEIIDNTT